jgi:hypothetical protein
MLKCNFSIQQITADKIFIVDNDIGKTVTNSAEEVCTHLFKIHGNKRILYKDTQGEWAELVHENGEFIGFSPVSAEDFSS